MPRKKVVDAKKLVEAVESGRTSKEIMDQFDIGTLAQLKSAYVDALAEVSKIPPLPGPRKPKLEEPPRLPKELKVNRRGSLIVPREMIDDMGFEIGDTFSVRKTLAGVSLRRV